MKRLAALFMCGAMLFSMAGCSGTAGSDSSKDGGAQAQADSDLKYIKDKGSLVVGITDFEPMDYKKDGEWIGFDADLAKAFAEKLGVKCEFVEIEWDSKIMELDGKTIDCVWNGMTLTDEVKSSMNCSNPYLDNAQVVVVKKDTDASDLTKLTFAVESGSAGDKAAQEKSYQTVQVKDQATALMEVEAGTSDAAIIDALMASAMIGEGTSYEDLITGESLTSEQYGVGFRKNSDVTAELNSFLKECDSNGKLSEIGKTYKVDKALVKQ